MRPLTLLSAILYAFLQPYSPLLPKPINLKVSKSLNSCKRETSPPSHHYLTQDTDFFFLIYDSGNGFPNAGREKVSDLGKGNDSCMIYTGTQYETEADAEFRFSKLHPSTSTSYSFRRKTSLCSDGDFHRSPSKQGPAYHLCAEVILCSEQP